MRFDAKHWARALLATIEEQGEDKIDQVVEALVQELYAIHQISQWREVVRELDRVWKEKYGAANITIVTATTLPEDVLATIKERFMGASIKVQTDPEAIGGTSIRIDDLIIDGTLRTRLTALKQQLTR